MWWLLSVDQFGDQAIDRVDVAATGPTSPVPPGLAHLPGPGQYDASPALERLLASTPTDQLAERFAGHQTGTIGPAGLPSPNSLIIVIGHNSHQLSLVPGAVEVRGIQQTPSSCDACKSGAGSAFALQWILAIGAVALLLPVLILISTASRLSAARREERFAAMRLVGATPRQISVISAVEATVAAFAGVALGFVLFFLLRPLLYRVPFTGAPLAAGDLSLRAIDIAIVVIGVPIAAIVSARLALRRVQISPLGVSRRTTSASPRVFRVIPLLAGIALLAYFDAAGKPNSNSGQQLEFLLGFGLLVVGLVLAGPWFTTAGARLMAHRASRPATLIAGRRLLDNPKTAFRFVSGLVIALFITSAAIGALSSIAAASSAGRGSIGNDTLAVPFCGFSTELSCFRASSFGYEPDACCAPHDARSQRCDRGPRQPSSSAEELVRTVSRSTGGFVRSRLVRPTGGDARHREVRPRGDGGECRLFPLERPRAQLSRLHDGVAEARISLRPRSRGSQSTQWSSPPTGQRARSNGHERHSNEPFPSKGLPWRSWRSIPLRRGSLAAIQDMTAVIIVASLIIAACSLAVNVMAGLGERKRPFSLLRLAGLPLSILRRVITLESALPLFVVAGVSLVVGLVAAALYLSSQVGISFEVPGTTYWAAVFGGLAVSLAIVASTFPLLSRMTGPEAARNA